MSFLNNIGSTEIIIIAIVIFVLFGGKKMTEWGKGLGEAGRELKKAKKEFEGALNEEEKSSGKPITEAKPKERKGVA